MPAEQWNPGTLMETSGYYWKTCALHAAVNLDLFTTIGNASASAAEVAAAAACAVDGMQRLLGAVAAMGLLEKKNDRYTNTAAARNFLCRDSDRYLGHMIRHHHHLMESWAHLDEAVRSGGPIRQRAAHRSDDWRESFLMGMFNNAMNLAPRLVPRIDLGGRRHLLDLGGGPGTYAIHFCRHNPGLAATVFDLPTTRPFAEGVIARFGMADRVEFVEGDYLKDDLGGGYDVAWLSHILHAEGPEDCRRIVAKAVKALEPGGLIAVHEFVLDDTLAAPLFPALFSLNMLLGTEAGRAYSRRQLTEMLTGAGVGDIRHITFDSPTESSLLTGTVG